MQDDIYKKPVSSIKPFEFDERVADVFPDMISRSVPGYNASFEIVSAVTREYEKPNTNLYDLGSSLGAATLAMRHSVKNDSCTIKAVDNSKAMIERCQKQFERDSSSVPVEFICDDVCNVKIENASVIVMNYTLQFIPVEARLSLLKNILDGLHEGCVLLLSEKFINEDKEENERLIKLHHQFKRLNGYDDMEIAQKRAAIENVLVPETIEQHEARLEQAGFSKVSWLSKSLNFGSLLAIK